ncbi:hypothetical protein [Thermus sp.]|uniref:hypothetical protein n=1 Tax=Thermus sp. TaxID=275 RepID=UPI003D0C901E
MNQLKKVLVGAFVVFMGYSFAQGVTGDNQGEALKPKFQMGLDSLTIAWPTADEKGGILGSIGINLGLGVSYRSYFEPLYPQRGAVYWEAGTVLLIVPAYVGVGYDYRFDRHFYVGGGVNLAPLALLAGTWPIYPSIHLGAYLY